MVVLDYAWNVDDFVVQGGRLHVSCTKLRVERAGE